MLTVQLQSYNREGPQRRIGMVASRLTNFEPALVKAAEYIREQTRQRFEMRGMGEWPPLAESTVERKVSQGAPYPEAPLRGMTGNLYESVTSAHGPYSYTVLEPTFIVIGVDWNVGGWQIGAVLSEGTEGARGYRGRQGRYPRGRHPPTWGIPPRPIYPPSLTVINEVSRIIRAWVRFGGAE
jgi:hypothetical protein